MRHRRIPSLLIGVLMLISTGCGGGGGSDEQGFIGQPDLIAQRLRAGGHVASNVTLPASVNVTDASCTQGASNRDFDCSITGMSSGQPQTLFVSVRVDVDGRSFSVTNAGGTPPSGN
jgi:hypothetical protein